MREYATRLHEALKPIIGRIRHFDLTDAEVEAFDAVILHEYPPFPQTDDKMLQTIGVAVYALIDTWEDWKRTLPMMRTSNNVRCSTGERMGYRNGDLEVALGPPRMRRLETVFQLLDEKVARNKIAETLDWKNEAGEWDHERVEREISAGREACKPTEQPVPRIDLTSGYRDALRLWPALMERKAHDQRQIEAAKPVAPETLEELIAQKVGVKQIAEMKGISQEEVEDRAKQMGVRIPGMKSVLMMAVSPPEEPSEEEEIAEMQRLFGAASCFKAKASDSENVALLLKKGLNAAEIVKAFKLHGKNVTLLEVADLLEGAAA